jgi:hypothetical protein
VLPLPLAANAIDTFARPSQQVLTVVEILHVTSEEQLDASIVIDERAVVLETGSRKSLAVFSAYQLITTAAPLAWPGTSRDVLFDDDETEVPDVKDCELPPLTV